MKLVIIFFMVAMMFVQSSWSTVAVPGLDCPVKFKGTIKEIIKPVGADSGFNTDRVLFSVTEEIEGDSGEQVQLDVLQHGPFDFEPGAEYLVQTRNGRLCWVEKI